MVKSLVLISCLLVVSCSDYSGQNNEPLGICCPFSSDDTQSLCHRYMRMISNAEIFYYGVNNEYTADILELQEFLPEPAESISCPVNGEYSIQVDNYEDIFIIECPSELEPSHGFIYEGFQSWPPDPVYYQDYCRDMMQIIDTACMCYYGKYNTFPDSLGDLAEMLPLEYVLCPLNGDYVCYGDDDTYFIACPAEHGISHGYIDDGSPSWPD